MRLIEIERWRSSEQGEGEEEEEKREREGESEVNSSLRLNLADYDSRLTFERQFDDIGANSANGE